MSNDDETPEKPTEERKEAAAPRPRKIVRRSVSTRDNPAFTEPAPGEAAAAPEASESPAPVESASPGAPAPAAAARPRATFDARAPRPRPAPGDARPPRPARPQRGPGPGGGRERPQTSGGDYRPPPARPIGARPIPGGSRAPASASSGDYRPPPARPIGARPIPGGSRAPAPPPGERRELRPRSAEGEAPPPRPAPSAPRSEGSANGPQARPHANAPRATGPVPVPAPARTAAGKAPPPPLAKPTARPVPVFIPLARAGQVAPASAKPALTPKEALAAKTKAHAAKTAAKPAPKARESAPAGTGFDAELVNAGADGAIAAITKAGEGAVALVDAWMAASNAAAIAEAVESDAVPGAARKAARRALNVLRSRGVSVPVRAHVVKLDDRAERSNLALEATLTPPDGSGILGLIITRREPSGRYHLAQVFFREPAGIVQAGGGWLSGSQLKENRNRMLEGLGVAPVPVPVDWARARIAAARKQNATSGQVVPLGFDACRDLVEPAPESAPQHPLADLEAEITSERAATAALTSGRLLNEPEFDTWLPDRGALDELLRKLGERLGPEGVSDPAAVGPALREETQAATDRFFSPEVRSVIAGRMRDAAISIRARKGDRAAAEALGVARAVLEAGLITSPPQEIPFLVAFFEKALSILSHQSGGRISVPVSGPQPSQAPPA
jgi:hypothetical protein